MHPGRCGSQKRMGAFGVVVVDEVGGVVGGRVCSVWPQALRVTIIVIKDTRSRIFAFILLVIAKGVPGDLCVPAKQKMSRF